MLRDSGNVSHEFAVMSPLCERECVKGAYIVCFAHPERPQKLHRVIPFKVWNTFQGVREHVVKMCVGTWVRGM